MTDVTFKSHNSGVQSVYVDGHYILTVPDCIMNGDVNRAYINQLVASAFGEGYASAINDIKKQLNF